MQRLLLTLCFFTFNIPNFAQESTEGFSIVREDADIFIYERWITFPNSSPPVKAREVRGDFKVQSTVAAALDLIQSESMIKKWQDHVSEFKVYLTDDTSTWQEYSYHDIPWPVSDQDHFLEYRIEEGSTADKIFITFQTKVNESLAPDREDVSRMSLHGSWHLEKINENTIHASYRILSKPSSIPRIFTDPVIRNNLMRTIKSFIEILEGRKK